MEQMGLAVGGQDELVSYELTEKAHVVANELRDRFSDPVEALLLPAGDYEPEEEVLEKMLDQTKPAIAEALALARERRTREAVAQPFSSQAQQTTATGPAASAGGRGSTIVAPMRNAQGNVMRHLRQQADGASPRSALWMANGSASRANAYPGGQPEIIFQHPVPTTSHRSGPHTPGAQADMVAVTTTAVEWRSSVSSHPGTMIENDYSGNSEKRPN